MRAPTSLTAALVACALAVTAPALAGTPLAQADGDRGAQQRLAERHHPRHSSDNEPGAVAPEVPLFRRGTTTTSDVVTRDIAPGIVFTRWDRTDARGPIRAYLLRIDADQPGLRIDYASIGPVRETAPVTEILARDAAIAGVNADFFDIGDTGAPLGLGRDRQRGLLHGRRSGYNSAFYIDPAGDPQIGPLALEARVTRHPELAVTNLNSPFVAPGGIGIYDARWGRTAGYRVTDGQKRNVRMVQIRHGRVRATATRLPKGTTIRGTLLIGRGDGANALRRLKVGTRAGVAHTLSEPVQMAISGNVFLVRDGLLNVTDDREMHPRTAVGIDDDTGEVLMLAIDGRQSFSRGYTMVELANLMVELGADRALNLDGGGSTTMVTKRPRGRIGVVNRPSDGFQRPVANALQVTYTPPT
jgi:hypothetical protein